jgi:8-oxo-dGTP pyrophosphatase MutT (NUDIX family)
MGIEWRMFRFCPSCRSEKITFEKNKFRCPDCGFVYYHNTAAAVACFIHIPDFPSESGAREERILFLERGREPGLGKLDLPGGFIDPGESVFEGLARELREELGWTLPRGENPEKRFSLFASFPNIYPYKGIVYNTCDMFFTVSVPGLSEKDISLQKSEVRGARFLKPGEIDPENVAFESVKRAISVYIH